MADIVDLVPRLRKPASSHDRDRRLIEKSEREGGSAWARLRHGNRRLSVADRQAIASRLEREIAAAGLSHAEVGALAGISDGSKGVYRCTLPEGADPGTRRLRAHARDYVQLILAVHRHTGENVHCLVDRVTIGTTVHPTRCADLSDVQALEAALQQIANRIDRDFGLLDAFRRIAHWRATRFGRSDWSRWPMYEWLPEDIDDGRIEEEKAHLRRPANAYYDPCFDAVQHPRLSGFDLREAMRYLPAVLLGFRFDWQEYRSDMRGRCGGDLAAAVEHENRIRQLLVDDFVALGATEWQHLDKESVVMLMDCATTWVALYPDPDMSAVVPVLLTNEEEAGTACVQLTAQNLIRLQEVDLVSTGSLSAFERIQREVAHGLEERLRAVAGNLHSQPCLVEAAAQQLASRMVRSSLAAEPEPALGQPDAPGLS